MSHQGNIDAQQAEIDHLRAIVFDSMLGRRIQSLEAEIDWLTARVAALREAVMAGHSTYVSGEHDPLCLGCQVKNRALADTEAVAREHDQRLRLEGARELYQRMDDAHDLVDVLAEMEREAGQ